ncbi:MAG TPA: radical SAM protein [Thermodesulfobacteriota bacterium]|nr:radical SAM protein [Thermodesulfobacteriota bacterium]
MREKVLLLNPPGNMPYIRDYYCSKVSKGSYIYPPTDLVVLSGIIAEKYDVAVLDAMALGMDAGLCMTEIGNISPKAIVALAGAVSYHEDAPFLENIKRRYDMPIIVTGDLFLEDGEIILKNYPFLDAILMDFTNADAIAYLDDKEDKIKNMIYRKDGEIKIKISPRTTEKEYTIPIPRHELFMDNYNYPFVRRRPFATVLTDYGCPYHCSFCVIETLGFKQRPVDNVIAELRYLKTLGFREIYFNDQTFGIKRTRAEELCDRIAKEGLGFGWVCWSRVDVINEELLKLMKGAGCHTILFGVETASEKSLKSMGKGYTLREVEETFRLCKKYGVRTLATYILGLPGENKKDIIKTIEFAIKLDSDFVSFNTLIPRAGTQIRQYAINSGWIAE